MAAYIDVNAAISEAKRLLQKKADVLAEVAIVRTDLRNAITMKVATAEQVKWIEEQFPLRERTTDPEAQVAKLEAKLQDIRNRQSKGRTKTAA